MPSRIGLLLLLACCSTLPAQTQPSEVEQERLREKARIEGEVGLLPAVRADSIEQMARLSIENDMLQAQTSIQSEHREVQVLIPQLKGSVTITLLGPRPDVLGGGSFFDVLQRDLTSPALGQVYTRISSYSGRINITRDSENQEWFTSVQLLQDPPPQPGIPMDEPPVRLYIHHAHSEEQAPPLRLKLEAASFLLLRLEHIPEMDRYVRPILRDLGQERNLFAVPDSIAWIAMNSTTAADPATLAKIAPLLVQLDADSFQERQKAVQELTKLGTPVVIALASLDRSKLTPQQQSEIASIVEDAMPLDQERLRKLADNSSFLLDVLFTDDPKLRQAALDRLGKLLGKTVELSQTSKAGERDIGVQNLRDRLFPPTTTPAP